MNPHLQSTCSIQHPATVSPLLNPAVRAFLPVYNFYDLYQFLAGIGKVCGGFLGEEDSEA